MIPTYILYHTSHLYLGIPNLNVSHTWKTCGSEVLLDLQIDWRLSTHKGRGLQHLNVHKQVAAARGMGMYCTYSLVTDMYCRYVWGDQLPGKRVQGPRAREVRPAGNLVKSVESINQMQRPCISMLSTRTNRLARDGGGSRLTTGKY